MGSCYICKQEAQTRAKASSSLGKYQYQEEEAWVCNPCLNKIKDYQTMLEGVRQI